MPIPPEPAEAITPMPPRTRDQTALMIHGSSCSAGPDCEETTVGDYRRADEVRGVFAAITWTLRS